MESFHEAWDLICDYCKAHITDVAYKTWISRIEPVKLDFDAGDAILMVPNEFHRQTLNRCYMPLLNSAVHEIFGSGINIIFTIPNEAGEKKAAPNDNLAIDSEYEFTFDTYIVGSSNKFAHAASLAVAANPAGAYNPLFIYGNSGLGKTHLLYAICNDLKRSHPEMTTLYIKGDDFTNELIDAIQHGTTSTFHQKYRKTDVLLVDDIQFIAGKDSTQEEFFHTFNSLYEAKKQIVLTSDRPPKEIQTLEDRLRTRFEWGLPVDIQPPDYETRVAIIKNKAIRRGMNLPDPVLQYIAENITSNVRQIEGTVNKILAFQELMGESVDVDTVTRAVRDMFKDKADFLPSPDIIIDEVSKFYNIDADALRGQGRTKDTALARQIAMYQIRRMTNLSLKEIGKEFEGRDHTTVMHSIDRIEKLTKTNPEIAEVIKDINANINARYE